MNALITRLETEKLNLRLKDDKELAELIGISPAEYSRLKSGERFLTSRQAQKIVKRFPDLYGLVGSILLQRPVDKRHPKVLISGRRGK